MNVVDATLPRMLFRSAFVALFMLGFSTAGLISTLYAWHLARQYFHFRTMCLGVSIGTALVATFFLAMAMLELDKPMLRHMPPWYVRAMLKVNKRIILVAQLVTTGVALASLFFLAFDFRIPAI